MKCRYRIPVFVFVLLFVTSVFMNIVMAVSGGKPEPGSEEDPLVSKSYVDEIISNYQTELEELQEKYEAVAKQLESLSGAQPGGRSAQAFEVVSLDAGKAIFTGSGTELVLRSGKATAIMGSNGGLSDVTSAKDLANKAPVALNHLLISSRDDGRGISAAAECWLLVRGAYKIGFPPADAGSGTGGGTGGSAGSGSGGNAGGGQEQSIGTGIVNASALNVRANPSTDAALLTKLYTGERVVVLSRQGDWYRIRTSGGLNGWVLGIYITME